jgi:hypothetical protein
MAELFKTVTGGLWKFVYAWILPTALVVGACWLTILPKVRNLPAVAALSDLGSGSLWAEGLLAAFLILAVAVLLALNSTSLSRLLEGYTMPRGAYETGRAMQRQRRAGLKHAFDSAPDALRRAAARRQLGFYPSTPDYIAPTRFGNALAAAETYGIAKFRMDYNIFWYELRGLAADSLRKDLEDAEAILGFFVALTYLSAGYAGLALVVATAGHDPGLVVAAAAAGLLARFFYLRAVQSTLSLRRATRAIVHLGRAKLAEEYGLTMPETMAKERSMWAALGAFTMKDDAEDQTDVVLDPDRLKPARAGQILDQYRAGAVPDDAKVDPRWSRWLRLELRDLADRLPGDGS